MTASDVAVRRAVRDDFPDAMNVLDGAMLDVDAGRVRERIDADDVLVAVEDSRVLGACVLDPRSGGAHVEAIAVRPGRRAQGIGSALIETAIERHGRLTAEFDPGVRPFYERLGFDVEAVRACRYRGTRDR